MPRRLTAMVAGAMAMAFAAAPIGVLHSQVVAPGTNPGRGTDTTRTPTTNPAPNPAPTSTPTPQTTVTGQATSAQAIQAEMRNDLPFLREAASANLMEIQLGQLAQSRASNSAVKEFGQRMVTDHTRLEQQLSSTVTRNAIELNAQINSDHQAKVTRLQSLSGTEFDQAYMSMMIQDHQTDAAKFDQQSLTADSPQIRALAANAVPILQQHLTLAQQVGTQVNAQPTAAVAGKQPVKASREFRADSKFIRENTADNYLEVSIARLAERKSQNSAVRDYARKIVIDHNRLQDDWVRMSSQNGLEYKTGIGKHHRDKLNQLEDVSARQFDRAYMTMEVQNHKDYIDYLQKEGRAAHSSQVREMVNRTLPVLLDHFAQAKRVGAQVGAETDVTLRSEKDKNKNKK
jgi:putative membrane protein